MSKVYDSLKTIALSFSKFSAKFAITMTLPFAQVLDVNDNAPVFTQLRYQTTVLEGSPARQLVLTVSATDIDTTKRRNCIFLGPNRFAVLYDWKKNRGDTHKYNSTGQGKDSGAELHSFGFRWKTHWNGWNQGEVWYCNSVSRM